MELGMTLDGHWGLASKRIRWKCVGSSDWTEAETEVRDRKHGSCPQMLGTGEN